MLASCRRPQAKLLQSPGLRPRNTQNHAKPSKKDHFLHLFCHNLRTIWQFKVLKLSRGGAEIEVNIGGGGANPSNIPTTFFEHIHIHTQFSNPIL